MRKVLFWCHLMAGCLAGVVIFIMSVTGVLLGFERQINSWADRGFQVQAGGARLRLEEVARNVSLGERQSPNVTVRAGATAPLEFAYGRDRIVYVDPGSGKVLGEASRSTRSFFSTVERIHRSLGSEMRSGPGRPITGACNLLFLFLVVSGIYLWLPKKWLFQFVRPAIWFRQGLRGRARDWNWHNTIGFMSAIPLFFVVLSGVIMSYQWANNLLYRLTGSEIPPAQQREGSGQRPPRRSREQGAQNLESLDALLNVAKQQNPSWRSISFRLPAGDERVISFNVDAGSGGQPQKRSQIAVDRVTGKVVQTEGFATYNTGRKLRTFARSLHTGEVLGLGGQIIATLTSIGGAFLVWTGLSLAIRRLAAQMRKVRVAEPSGTRRDEPVSV